MRAELPLHAPWSCGLLRLLPGQPAHLWLHICSTPCCRDCGAVGTKAAAENPLRRLLQGWVVYRNVTAVTNMPGYPKMQENLERWLEDAKNKRSAACGSPCCKRQPHAAYRLVEHHNRLPPGKEQQ